MARRRVYLANRVSRRVVGKTGFAKERTGKQLAPGDSPLTRDEVEL